MSARRRMSWGQVAGINMATGWLLLAVSVVTESQACMKAAAFGILSGIAYGIISLFFE